MIRKEPIQYSIHRRLDEIYKEHKYSSKCISYVLSKEDINKLLSNEK